MVNIRNEIKEAFEVRANEIGFCLDQRWGQYENPYTNNDTALAYNLFKDGWTAANNIRDEELNGCVVVPVEPTAHMMDCGSAAKFEHDTVGDIWNEMLEAARGVNHV